MKSAHVIEQDLFLASDKTAQIAGKVGQNRIWTMNYQMIAAKCSGEEMFAAIQTEEDVLVVGMV
jgi:hypothetical protein